jgi:hypothetical protein
MLVEKAPIPARHPDRKVSKLPFQVKTPLPLLPMVPIKTIRMISKSRLTQKILKATWSAAAMEI